MSIIRVHKQRGEFAVVPKSVVNDEALSWDARGMLLYLLEKPDDWKIFFQDLVKKSPAGADKTRRILHELEVAGYVRRRRYNKPDGTFAWESEVFETPQAQEAEAEQPCADFPYMVAEPYAGLPYMAKPSMVQPSMVNRHIYQEELRTNIDSNNNEENYDDGDDGRPPVAVHLGIATPAPAPVPVLPATSAQPFQPAIDPEWGAAIGLLQSQLGWMGSGGPTLDEMREFFDNLREKGLTDWWALAVKVAVDQNARSWAYMRSVLRTALESNRPPGSPKPQKGNNGNGNGTYRNGNGKSHPAYDDGLAALSAAERADLSAKLRASRQAPRLPGV